MIGLRPGEKLHERMISQYEEVRTYDIEFAYMITPALHFWDRDWVPQGIKVDNLNYTSDNVEQYTILELRNMIGELDA